MTMIERVARAILKARFYDYEPHAYGNSIDQFYREIDPDHVEASEYEARAAIEAVGDTLSDQADETEIGSHFAAMGAYLVEEAIGGRKP